MTAIQTDPRPADPAGRRHRRPSSVVVAVALMLVSSLGTWLVLPLTRGSFGLAFAMLVMVWTAVLVLAAVPVLLLLPASGRWFAVMRHHVQEWA